MIFTKSSVLLALARSDIFQVQTLALPTGSDILVEVGPSDNQSTEITVDNLTNYECPPTVNKDNWDTGTCSPHCDADDAFDVSVSGTKVTVQKPNANGWGINLAFTCSFIGTTSPSGSPSITVTGSPTGSPSVTGSPSAWGAWCSRIVHCLNGMAYNSRNGADFTSLTGNTCDVECAGQCCTGRDACRDGSFSVCADGSCDGNNACNGLGGKWDNPGSIEMGSVGLVSGPSCTGGPESCMRAGNEGAVGDITNSCNEEQACMRAGNEGAVGDITNSCNGGPWVCYYTGASGGSIGDITNGCLGDRACREMGRNNGIIGDVTNSCLGGQACGGMGVAGRVGDVSDACNGDNACSRVAYQNTQFASNTILDNCCVGPNACESRGCLGLHSMYGCVPMEDGTCPAATASPTGNPTVSPTSKPTSSPSSSLTDDPTPSPTTIPSASPSGSPSSKPTADPTADPTTSPTDTPTSKPSGTPTPIPSGIPSGIPTANPSASPTESPTESPTDSPTKSPTESPTKAPKFVVCGKGTGCRGGNVEPAAESEVHPVRCCANTRLGAGWKKQDHCNVWASSLTRHCHEASFAKAWQLCDYAGARLCTATELADSCTIQSGCGFDGRLVWSSSPEVDLEKELQDLREELAQCRGDVQ